MMLELDSPSLYRDHQNRSRMRTLSRESRDLTWFSYGPILEPSPARGNDDDEALVDRCPAQFCLGGWLFVEQRQQRASARTRGRTTGGAGGRARTTGRSTGRASTRPGPSAATRACASATVTQHSVIERVVGACASTSCVGTCGAGRASASDVP